jgi:tetratricopeptide (TPR) repeat protein
VWPHVFAAIAIVFGSALALWRRPTLGFGCCAFLLLLAPTTSFVPIIQQPIAESRMYLPLAALIATAVGALHFFARRRAGAIVAALVLAFIALTVARNRAYRSPLTLWSDTVAKAPQNARAQNYLGAALLEAGRANDALQAFARATTLRPGYADAHNNFGVALLQTGRAPDAIASLGNALRLNPQFAAAHFNLGNALAAAGRAAEARAEFLAALQINPRFAAAAYNLGILASRAGDARAAIAYFETVLRIEPDYTEARRNLELARRRAGP